MEIWETNLTGKGLCLYSPKWIQQTHMASSSEDSTQQGPPAFKIERKQQKPQEEEIPIWAMVALKISRKYHPRRHQPYGLPTWGQIKTLTKWAENLVFQQGMPRSPEYIFLAMLSLLPCASPVRALTNHTSWAYIPNPLYYRWLNGQREDQSYHLMTPHICLLPAALKGPRTLKKKEN